MAQPGTPGATTQCLVAAPPVAHASGRCGLGLPYRVSMVALVMLCAAVAASAAASSPCEAAAKSLRAKERAQLCDGAGAGTGPAECWAAMRAVSSLPRPFKIELCQGATSGAVAACFHASPARLGAEARASLCKVWRYRRPMHLHHGAVVNVCVRCCVGRREHRPRRPVLVLKHWLAPTFAARSSSWASAAARLQTATPLRVRSRCPRLCLRPRPSACAAVTAPLARPSASKPRRTGGANCRTPVPSLCARPLRSLLAWPIV